MAWEEKYGGIWLPRLQSGESIHFERYLPDLDIVTLSSNELIAYYRLLY